MALENTYSCREGTPFLLLLGTPPTFDGEGGRGVMGEEGGKGARRGRGGGRGGGGGMCRGMYSFNVQP